MNNKIKFGIGAGIAVLLAAGGVYHSFSSDTKTPEYAIKSLEQSISEHNKQEFYESVNLDDVLNSSYEGLVEGLTDAEKDMPPEAKDAVKNFTQMLKSPMLLSLKSAIDSFVETGKFNAQENAGVSELLRRTGIDKIEFRGIGGVKINPENENEATAKIKIFQSEIGGEFIMDTVLNKNPEGKWQIVRLENFRDFIAQINEVRRAQVAQYLAQATEINSRHDQTIHEAEQKYSSILSLGGLAQDNTRSALKTLLLDVVKKDWEVRKQELFSLSVPQDAEGLQSLQLKVCDFEIGYAEEYAKWMEDKKVSTLQSAEEKQRQAHALTTEATALAAKLSR